MKDRVTGEVPFQEKLSYSLSSSGGNIVTQILGIFYVSYLTDSVGIAAAAVGTMLLIARFIDALSDVLMGYVIDKTNTKWGKARPWLLISAPFNLIALVLAFSIPNDMSDGGKLIFAYLSYFFLNCLCFTAYMIANTALLSRITLNGQERQKMASMNQIMNQVTALSVTTFMVVLVKQYGWQTTAIIYGFVTMLLILVGFFFTRERLNVFEDPQSNKKEDKIPLKVAVKAIRQNKYFFMLTALFILILAQAAGPGSMTYYFSNNVLNDISMVAFISACGIVPTIIINFFVPNLVNRFGKRNLFLASAIGNTIGFLLIGIFSTSITMVAVGSIIKGFAAGVLFACGFAMASDVVDYGEWKTGIRSEGLINSCVSFGQKVGLGIGPAIATWILAAGGYDGTAILQSASAQSAITFAFSYYGAILSVLIVIIAWFLDIDKYTNQFRVDLEKKYSLQKEVNNAI